MNLVMSECLITLISAQKIDEPKKKKIMQKKPKKSLLSFNLDEIAENYIVKFHVSPYAWHEQTIPKTTYYYYYLKLSLMNQRRRKIRKKN